MKNIEQFIDDLLCRESSFIEVIFSVSNLYKLFEHELVFYTIYQLAELPRDIDFYTKRNMLTV